MITRKGPDGKTYQFNDGTSEKEMAAAFTSVYGDPAPARTPYVASQTPYGEIADDLGATAGAAVDNAGTVMDRNQAELGSVVTERGNEGMSPTDSLFGAREGSGIMAAPTSQDARPQNMQELAALNVAEGVIPAGIEMIGGAVAAAAKVLSNVTPDYIENPAVNAALDIGNAIVESPLMQQGIELAKENYPKYLTWAKANPFYDRAIKATFNMTALATKTPVSFIGKLGDKALESGNKSSYKNRRRNVEQMLEPLHPETSDMTQTMTPTRTEGLLGRIVPNYNDSANEVIDITALVPKLKPNGSFSDSRNVIYGEITSTAKRLRADIVKAGNPMVASDLTERLEDAADHLKEATGYSLAGGTLKFADDLMKTAIRFVKESDGTAAGILDARKELDKFISKHQPESLTQDYINSKTKAVAEIRTLLNEAVQEAVPDVDVSGLLKKQHKLYRAWDVVGDKAVKESRLAIGRTFNQIVRNNVSMPSTPMSLAYTATGTGYWLASGNGLFTVGALGAATAGAIGYKVMTGPKLRQTVGWLLKGVNGTLKKTKAADVVEQLKADRLILIGVLSDLEKEADRPPLLSAASR
jgi:hypothetical protein